MSGDRSAQVRAYRALILLYPPSFRDDYRDLMVQIFQDDLDERGTRRVWSRTVGDLLVSMAMPPFCTSSRNFPPVLNHRRGELLRLTARGKA